MCISYVLRCILNGCKCAGNNRHLELATTTRHARRRRRRRRVAYSESDIAVRVYRSEWRGPNCRSWKSITMHTYIQARCRCRIDRILYECSIDSRGRRDFQRHISNAMPPCQVSLVRVHLWHGVHECSCVFVCLCVVAVGTGV